MQRRQKIFGRYSLVSDGAEAGGLIVLLAVDVGAVAELLVAPEHGPPPLLVLEVPVETGEGSVLLTLVLQEQWALFNSKLLQVPGIIETFRL